MRTENINSKKKDFSKEQLSHLLLVSRLPTGTAEWIFIQQQALPKKAATMTDLGELKHTFAFNFPLFLKIQTPDVWETVLSDDATVKGTEF